MGIKNIGTVACPNCGKKVIWDDKSKYRPFCGERCKLIDLGEWADQGRTIPGEPAPSIDNTSEWAE